LAEWIKKIHCKCVCNDFISKKKVKNSPHPNADPQGEREFPFPWRLSQKSIEWCFSRHAGLDPASRNPLDSGFCRNDGAKALLAFCNGMHFFAILFKHLNPG
jgi:hypothetical protein